MEAFQNELSFSEFPPLGKSDWVAEALRSLKLENLDSLQSQTYEGIVLAPFYTSEDRPETGLAPHEFPDGWQNRVEIVGKVPAEANALAKKALEQGADAVCFDLRYTENLYYTGLLRGFEQTRLNWILPLNFKEIDALAKWNGPGTIDFDFLSRWTYRGQQPPAGFKTLKALLSLSKSKISQRALTLNAQPFGLAGAHAGQELGLALSLLTEYIDQLRDASLSAEALFKQAEFSLVVGPHFFMEVAKFRALRVLWKQLLAAYEVDFFPARLHARTTTLNKSRLDAYNNLLRTTTEAMSAVIGGVNALTVGPYDEISGQSDDFSRRIARNVSTILKAEAHLDQVSDLAAGAYFIDYLTVALAQKAWAFFQQIEQMGGFSAAFTQGFIKTEIESVARLRRLALQEEKQILVGVNRYKNPKDQPLPPNKPEKKTSSDLPLLSLARWAEPWEEAL